MDDITAEDTTRARAAYFACVDQLDEIIGDFLALLDRDGLLDNTIIVYTSDHGELAGEHGLWWKNTWHEASARVPLIISLPEHRNGSLSPSENTQPVGLGDLIPTLCGLTGTPIPEDLDGMDLSAIVRGEIDNVLRNRPGVIMEYLNPLGGSGTEYRMIRSERYKYVAFHDCEDLSFDLDTDPDEQYNIADTTDPEVAGELDRLRSALYEGFDFDAAIDRRQTETEQFRTQYAGRVTPRTSNQILLGDGRLVEADLTLEYPDVVSDQPGQDFDDWPE